MTRKEFNIGFATLLNAFSYAAERTTPESEDVYWEMLKDIPREIWQEGLKKCLAGCKYFPTINEIGVACFGEQKEETVWKTDPYRTPQNYREKIPAETWRDRLARTLKARGLLPAPQTVAELPPPKPKRDEVIEKMTNLIRDLTRDRDALQTENTALKRQIVQLEQEAKRPSIEERRAALREQAKMLQGQRS